MMNLTPRGILYFRDVEGAVARQLPGCQWHPVKKVWYVSYPDPGEVLHFARAHSLSLSPECEAWLQSSQACDIPKIIHRPWEHQKRAYAYLCASRAALLDMGMGTGKTSVAINFIVNNPIMTTLVVCPKSVIPVWPYQIAEHAAEPLEVLPLTGGSSANKAERLSESLSAFDPLYHPKLVVVINYESVWRPEIAKVALGHIWDLVVLDELQKIKKPGGRASRFAARLRDKAKRRVGLTGTPMAHSPLDLYGQYRFLDPSIFGTNYRKFRDRYAIMGGYGDLQVIGYRNQREMAERMNRIRFHAGREVLDLPPAVHQTIPIELDNKPWGIYRDLEDTFYAQVESGEITVSNALVKLLRLQQLTSGHIKDDGGVVREIHTAKMAALVDYLDALEKDEPVVVFCRFRHDLEMIERAALLLGWRSFELSGKRKELEQWDGGVLAVQIGAGAEGIDLTRAHYCVFFSVSFSLGQYEQALARCHRPGQTDTVFYAHLVVQRSIDQTVYRALSSRKDVVESILSMPLERDQRHG